MKLLFDENLSFRLCRKLNDLFPDSSQVRLIGLERADDHAIWRYAKANEFVLVTLDAESNLATLRQSGDPGNRSAAARSRRPHPRIRAQ
jgi:predicted nuclease of predicted toxin-antitoxin system